jgi:3-deoxy-alpha-D-manno-octulosonate 8-oxidase
MQFRNFKMVSYVVYGRGCFNQLDEILAPQRKSGAPMIFLVDHFFEGKELLNRIPIRGKDKIIFADVTNEPKTTYVDKIAQSLKDEFGKVSGVIGIGGGSTLDLAKAVSLMMTNPGSSADYQGWDLVKFPGVYKAGIPTLSGTGAEVSRTTVLTGPTRKLGMNSDFTPFDQIVLDPQLTINVPANQRFYTGMDCYIHCIESLQGTYLNEFSKSYGEKALQLCQKVFVEKDHWDDESDEQLMMAFVCRWNEHRILPGRCCACGKLWTELSSWHQSMASEIASYLISWKNSILPVWKNLKGWLKRIRLIFHRI